MEREPKPNRLETALFWLLFVLGLVVVVGPMLLGVWLWLVW